MVTWIWIERTDEIHGPYSEIKGTLNGFINWDIRSNMYITFWESKIWGEKRKKFKSKAIPFHNNIASVFKTHIWSTSHLVHENLIWLNRSTRYLICQPIVRCVHRSRTNGESFVIATLCWLGHINSRHLTVRTAHTCWNPNKDKSLVKGIPCSEPYCLQIPRWSNWHHSCVYV